MSQVPEEVMKAAENFLDVLEKNLPEKNSPSSPPPSPPPNPPEKPMKHVDLFIRFLSGRTLQYRGNSCIISTGNFFKVVDEKGRFIAIFPQSQIESISGSTYI
jgi:hypothetical protein